MVLRPSFHCLWLLLVTNCLADPCTPDPCENEGKCELDSSMSSGYVCVCTDGSVRNTTCLPPAIQIPEVCIKKYKLRKSGMNDSVEFQVAYDRTTWDKYLPSGNKICTYTFNMARLSTKRLNILIDIKSAERMEAGDCHFDMLLYSRSTSSQYIKKLDCAAVGQFSVPWPSDKLVITFPQRQGATGNQTSSLKPTTIKVGFEYCDTCGFNKYGYTGDDFYEYQIPYYDVPAKSQCGTEGCLENVLQGYMVLPYIDMFSLSSKRCNLILNVKAGTTVCIKQKRRPVSLSCTSVLSTTIMKLYVGGKKYLDIECSDVPQWWCMPWDVGGKEMQFSWTLSYATYGQKSRKLYIVSPSANKQAKLCGKPKFTNRTIKDPWDTWSSWSNSDSWTSWSSSDSWSSWDSDETDYDTTDDDNRPVIIAVVVPLVVIFTCCIMGYHCTKKSRHERRSLTSNYQSPQFDVEYVTSSDTRNPVYRSTSRSNTQAGATSYSNTGAGASNITHTSPSAPSPEYTTISDAPPPYEMSVIQPPPPPPSYNDVMKSSGEFQESRSDIEYDDAHHGNKDFDTGN